MPIGSQTRGAAVRPTASMVSGRHPSNSWRTACRRATSSAGAGRVWPREVVRPGGIPHRDGQRADVVLPTAMWADRTGACTNADWTGHLQGRPRPAVARGAQPGMPAAVHYRPDRQSLLQPGHDRPRPAEDRRRPGVWVELSEADAAGWRCPRETWSKPPSPAAIWTPRRESPASSPGCSARSSTAIGASRRATAPTGRAGRQPVHHHRVGPSLQAAALKRPDRKSSPWAEGYRP